MSILGNDSSGGKKPTTPIIGTATDGGTGTTVSVPFTPSTYIGKGTITYTALSSPGSISATSSGTPITVSGLTTGTAYTFTVTGNTNYGVVSDASAASNSVAPVSPGAFDSIATATPSGVGSVTFSGIPQTYAHLELRILSQTSVSSVSGSTMTCRINNDSNTNYYYSEIISQGNDVNASVNYADTNLYYLYTWQSGYGSSFGTSIVNIMDYTNTNKRKIVRYISGLAAVGSGGNNQMYISNLQYNSTSAVTSLTFTANAGNFVSGTSFALYGIRGS